MAASDADAFFAIMLVINENIRQILNYPFNSQKSFIMQVFVMQTSTHPSAQTVSKVGWELHVKYLALTGIKYLWIAETVSVTHVIPDAAVTVFVPGTVHVELITLVYAPFLVAGVENYVKLQAVRVSKQIARVMGCVTAKLRYVSVIPDGPELDVIFLIALELQIASDEGSATQLAEQLLNVQIVLQAGWDRLVMIDVFMENGFTTRYRRNGFACATYVTQVLLFELTFFQMIKVFNLSGKFEEGFKETRVNVVTKALL